MWGKANVHYACVNLLIPEKLKGKNFILENSALVISRLYIISLQFCLIIKLVWGYGEPHTTLLLPATFLRHILYIFHTTDHSVLPLDSSSFVSLHNIKSHISHIFKRLSKDKLRCKRNTEALLSISQECYLCLLSCLITYTVEFMSAFAV